MSHPTAARKLAKETTPPAGLEYPFLHRVIEIREEEWERVRQYLIGTLGEDPQNAREPNLEHCHEPAHHLNIMGMILVRGALVESEIYGQMDHIQTQYLKLLGEVTSLRVIRRVDSEQAVETTALSASEVDGLRQELEESKRKAMRLDEALQERYHALV
ncbi:uncharacterized protein A4U43_C07F26340 [Asparagus officinalis]|uniref:Uncharacterized protein n=1 Tax=Asparagus officinalis TaxID=4686 RepID=A0A5P1EF17_ASPOF|nr:uncharacterized protein A4U43_C07F26340 [Asparagus officinalis]